MSMQSGQPMDMSKVDALSVPEVLLLVGQFLSRSALAQCLLVCHSWHLALKPLLWKVIEVKSLNATHSPPLQAIQENASYIRKLTVEYKVVVNPQWNLTCPHLNDLTVNELGYEHRITSEFYEYPLADLIQKHRGTLRNATIRVKVGEPVLVALLDYPRLEALTFTNEIQIKRISNWMQMYQKLRLRLHTFALKGLRLMGGKTEVVTPAQIEEWYRSCAEPSRIRDLTLFIGGSDENTVSPRYSEQRFGG